MGYKGNLGKMLLHGAHAIAQVEDMGETGGSGGERVWFASWAEVLERSAPPETTVQHRQAIVQFLSATKKQQKSVNVQWAADYLKALQFDRSRLHERDRYAVRSFSDRRSNLRVGKWRHGGVRWWPTLD